MDYQIKNLNYINYKGFLNNRIVLVDFWAEWCYPCKLQQKVVEELARENENIFIVGKVNVDDNKVISSNFGVQNIPALILFNNGNEISRITGMQSKEKILNQIKQALSVKNLV